MIKHLNNGIYGFIHIGVLGRWEKIFNSQVELLKTSGLADKTKKIFVGIAGDARKVKIPDFMELCSVDPILEHGENLTLKQLHHITTEYIGGHSKIWYIHTKAARHQDNRFEAMCGDSWRNYMQYFIIERYEDCIKALNDYDIAGVEWHDDHFAGNFWWAQSNYIKRIENPVQGDNSMGDRFLAEFNFINNNSPIVKNFYGLNPDDMYSKYIERYVDINNKIQFRINNSKIHSNI